MRIRRRTGRPTPCRAVHPSTPHGRDARRGIAARRTPAAPRGMALHPAEARTARCRARTRRTRRSPGHDGCCYPALSPARAGIELRFSRTPPPRLQAPRAWSCIVLMATRDPAERGAPVHLTIGRHSEYDAIVVGARVAGAATAMLPARAGRRVLLVDRSTYGADTLSTHAVQRGGVMQLDRWVCSTRSGRRHTGDLAHSGPLRRRDRRSRAPRPIRRRRVVRALAAPSWTRSWSTRRSTPAPRSRSACTSSTSVAISTDEWSVSSRTVHHDEAFANAAIVVGADGTLSRFGT